MKINKGYKVVVTKENSTYFGWEGFVEDVYSSLVPGNGLYKPYIYETYVVKFEIINDSQSFNKSISIDFKVDEIEIEKVFRRNLQLTKLGL